MYEGEEQNSIDSLSEEPTDQPDGVKVIVPVKFSSKDDFVKKIKEQLAYFEGVYFDGPNLRNDFKIYREDHFQWSELSSDTSLHICLDNVYYPLDFVKLGISRINFPAALRFSLSDGIFPVPSRESLRYTPEAKEKILEKIKIVANFFVNRFNDSVSEVEDINVIFDYYANAHRNVRMENRIFDVVELKKHADGRISTPKLKGIKYLDLKDLYETRESILGEYRKRYEVGRYKMSECKEVSPLKLKDFSTHDYYVFDKKISGNMREYLKTLIKRDTFVVKKILPFTLGNQRSIKDDNYYRILELDTYPKHLWRKIIKEFQLIQSQYTKTFKDLDTMVISQEWLDKRKRLRVINTSPRRTKLTGEVTCKIGKNLEKSISGRSCKFVATTLKLEDLHKFKGLTVYAHHDDFLKLDPIYGTAYFKQGMRVLTFSDRELKIIKQLDIHNLISYEKFMEGKNMPFKRIVTAHLIERLIAENAAVFEKRNVFESISKDLYNKFNLLHQYKNNYFGYGDAKLYLAMLEVARRYNLFDPSIYDTYVEIKLVLKKFTFLSSIMKVVNSSHSYSKSNTLDQSEAIKILCDLFKHYKYKIDLANYKMQEPEGLTDEDVEALTELVDDEEVLEEEEEDVI